MAYPDTFGGSIFNQNAIHELVISCALSDVAARIARSLILPWVKGQAVSFDLYEAGLIAFDGSRFERIYSDCVFPEAELIISNGSVDDSLSATYIASGAWKLAG